MRYLFSLMILLIVACRSATSYEILSESEMQMIVWDLLRANGLAQAEVLKNGKVESLLSDAEKYKQVFSSYSMRREDFLKSYNYYLTRPDRLKVILDSVSNMAIRNTEEIQRTP